MLMHLLFVIVPSLQGPECQTNSTDDNSSVFKKHHCCYCKQPHHRMMDHLQSVHSYEPEVAKALIFDKSSQERKEKDFLTFYKLGEIVYTTQMWFKVVNKIQNHL